MELKGCRYSRQSTRKVYKLIIDQQFMNEIRPMTGISMLRIGNRFDGGYLIPKQALYLCDQLISLGYGYDSSFEREFLKLNLNKQVILYDLDIDLVSSLSKLVNDVRLMKNGYRPFHYKRLFDYCRVLLTPRIKYNIGRIGHLNSPDCINLVDIFKGESMSNVILKMDIEGSEYESLELDLNVLNRCQCLIIEFHNINQRIEQFITTLKKILDEFTLVNTHINNNGPVVAGIPTVIELCFIRSSTIATEVLSPAHMIPHQDDLPCNPKIEEFIYRY